MNFSESPDVKSAPRVQSRIRTATGLLRGRQRLILVLLTFGRTAVGLCDLLVAAAMYLLFLLLQGRSISHYLWWMPRTVLSAAVVTMALVVLRALTDISSARSTFRQIQNLHTALLLRLTEGYSRIQWGRFVECNRSELSARALQTTREAADFYHRSIEMTANVVVVIVMTAALVYQSVAAACALGFAITAFYVGHRKFGPTGIRLSFRSVSVFRQNVWP